MCSSFDTYLEFIQTALLRRGEKNLSQRFLQPIRNDLRNSIFCADVEMVAVGDDDDFAEAGAVFFEAFGCIIVHWFLVAADEED